MSFFVGIDSSQQSFKLDRHVVYELDHFASSSSTVNQCIDLLDRFLFSNIHISGSTRMFQNYINEYFVPFFRSMLRQIIVLGWSAVHLRSIKDKRTGQKIKVPEVIDVEYVNPEIVLDKSKLSYDVSIYDHTGSEKIKGAIFLLFKDIQKVANQTLTSSILSGLVDDFRYIQQVRQFALQAEFVRTNPTIYLEEQKSDTAGASLAKKAEGLSVGIARNDDDGFDDPMNDVNNGARKNTPSEDLLKNASKSIAANFDFHNKAMSENHRVSVNGMYHQGRNFAPQYKNNIYIVPPGLTLAEKPTLPQSGIDFTGLERALNSKIYQKFGIPESLIGSAPVTSQQRSSGGSKGSGGSSTSGMQNNITRNNINVLDVISFEAVLDRYRRFFTDAMILIYEQIYGKKLKHEAIVFEAPKMYEEYVEQFSASAENPENESKNPTDKKKDLNQSDKPTDAPKEQKNNEGDKSDKKEMETPKEAEKGDGDKKDKPKESDKKANKKEIETPKEAEEGGGGDKKDKPKESDKKDKPKESDKKDKPKESDKKDKPKESDKKDKPKDDEESDSESDSESDETPRNKRKRKRDEKDKKINKKRKK